MIVTLTAMLIVAGIVGNWLSKGKSLDERSRAQIQSSNTTVTDPINKKVFLLDFDPILTSKNNQKLSSYLKWNNPYTVTNEIINWFKNTTNNRVNYSIVNQVELNEFPLKLDNFRYTESSYLYCISNSTQCHNPDEVKYIDILNRLDICGKLNRNEIDEFWMIGGPYFGFYESRLAGTNAFNYNSPPLTGTTCQKLMPIMGFNYERNSITAVHDFGHRTEDTMKHIFGSWEQNSRMHNWDIFGLERAHSPSFNSFGCGTMHFPPNTTTDADAYKYNMPNQVYSYCDAFNNYPNLGYIDQNAKLITCQVWQCTEGGYYQWWFQHLPHFAGQSADGRLNDWWLYIFDLNSIPKPTAGLYSNLDAVMYKDKVIFNFSYSGITSINTIDLSTSSNFGTDIYLNFSQGSASPIIEVNPNKWDKYQTCGRTLYWRIKSETNNFSSIQSATIKCINSPSPILSPTHITNTVTPTTSISYKIKGDLNNDKIVNIIDLSMLASNWGKTGTSPGDVNDDGKVDIIDLSILASNWGNAFN